MVRREAININYLLLLSSLLSSKSVRDWHDSSSIPATSVTLKRLTPFRLSELALHVLVRSVRSASNYPSSQISGKEPRCASYSFDLSRIRDLLSSKVQKRMTFLFPPPPLRALWQRRMRTLKPDGLKTWQVCAARERDWERESWERVEVTHCTVKVEHRGHFPMNESSSLHFSREQFQAFFTKR